MQLENQYIEYKERLNDKLEREVVGFLNSKLGGDMYIGVADNGQIIGVDNADAIQLAISDRLKNNILPSCLGGRSIPRNRELMRIFHDMEWVEQLGSGIHRILRKYPKDIYEISEHFVVVTFKFAESLTDTSNVSQNVSQSVSQKALSERQSLIRQRIIENNTISARLIAEELGVNIRTIYRELKQLNIHWIGSPKSGHWEFI